MSSSSPNTPHRFTETGINLLLMSVLVLALHHRTGVSRGAGGHPIGILSIGDPRGIGAAHIGALRIGGLGTDLIGAGADGTIPGTHTGVGDPVGVRAGDTAGDRVGDRAIHISRITSPIAPPMGPIQQEIVIHQEESIVLRIRP